MLRKKLGRGSFIGGSDTYGQLRIALRYSSDERRTDALSTVA